MTTKKTLPSFEELPLRKGDPPYSAWGLWGDGNQLGALNYLTDDLVAKTVKSEVRTGERVGLDLPLNLFTPVPAGSGRIQFQQKVVPYEPPNIVNDDVITMNTQSSAQWDSFRHFGYPNEKVFYGGVTQEHIHDVSNPSMANGLQPWTERQIAGRGVLIDWASYAERKGIKHEIFGQYGISVEDIEAIAKEENVEFHQGDIFTLRTGYAGAYMSLSPEEKEKIGNMRTWIGLGQSKGHLKWLWERQFSAVVADCPGFETRPQDDPAWHLHPFLLAGWGTPIAELFNLERLSELCKKNKRWTFFLTSAVLNYPGAVASPPNAIAIF